MIRWSFYYAIIFYGGKMMRFIGGYREIPNYRDIIGLSGLLFWFVYYVVWAPWWKFGSLRHGIAKFFTIRIGTLTKVLLTCFPHISVLRNHLILFVAVCKIEVPSYDVKIHLLSHFWYDLQLLGPQRLRIQTLQMHTVNAQSERFLPFLLLKLNNTGQ